MLMERTAVGEGYKMAKYPFPPSQTSQLSALEQRYGGGCHGLTPVSYYINQAAGKHEMPGGPTRVLSVKSP